MDRLAPHLHHLLPFTENYAKEHSLEKIPQDIINNFEHHHVIIKYPQGYKLTPTKLKRPLLVTLETIKEYEFYIQNEKLAEVIWHLTVYFPIIITQKGSEQKIIIIGKPLEQTNNVLKKHSKLKPIYITFEQFIEYTNQNHPMVQDIAKNHILCGRKDKIINVLMEYYHRSMS